MFEMEEVLGRLVLRILTVYFANEKITPDLVCKLSKYELLYLGVSSSSDIMKLRMECLKFGFRARASVKSSSYKIHYETRNTVSNAHKMIPPASPCFVWQSSCFALGNPKIIRIKT